MKILNFLFFLFCLNVSIYSQTDTSDFKRVQFFFPNGVLSSEGYLRNNKPDGYWISYHENGKIKSEGNRKNFELDGKWKFYDTIGNISMSIEYVNGKRHGARTTYFLDSKIIENFENDVKQGYSVHFYEDGTIKRRAFYKDGLLEGLTKEFDNEGNVILLLNYKSGFLIERRVINRKNSQANKHGVWLTFYESGVIQREENFRNGVLDGFVKEFDELGNLKSILKFENGIQQKEAEEVKQFEIRRDFFPDGRIKIVGSYYNNLPDGIMREFDQAGNIIKSYLFDEGAMIEKGIIDKKGLRQGYFIKYFTNGHKKAEGEYLNSVKVGEWKYYYPDGNLEQRGVFDRNGKPQGEWIWYYNNGNIWKKENYIAGLLDGDYVEYDINGNYIIKGSFIEDEEDGLWVYEINNIRETGNFKNGQKEGVWKTEDLKTNKILFQGRYVDGNPNGRHTYYWPNGQKRFEGNYIMGKREGDWNFFNEDGNVLVRVRYKQGIEIRYDNVYIDKAIN